MFDWLERPQDTSCITFSQFKNNRMIESENPLKRQSTINASQVMGNKKSQDPYELDFKQLRVKYMEDTTKKLKFSKASFLHYCQNPYVYAQIHGGEDTIITMELVQAPRGLKYTRLDDPDAVKKAEAARRKEELAKRKAEEKAEAMRLKQEQKRAEKEQQKAELQRQKDEAREERRAQRGSDDESQDEDTDEEDEASEQEEDYGSEDQDDDESSQEEDEDYDNELGYDSYGSYNEDQSGEEDQQSAGDEEQMYGDDDRQYNGEMFDEKKAKMIKYALNDRILKGELREKTDTVDYVVISTWRIGGKEIHYSRLADVIIPYPPVVTDERFYCSHTADALYYLTKKDGKQAIIVVNLGDFRWRLFDLSREGIPKLENLEKSALIYNNHVIVLNDESKKSKQALSGDFIAFDLFTEEKVWYVKNAERVFIQGKPLEEVPQDEELDGRNLKKNVDNKQITEDPAKKSFQQKVDDGDIEAPDRVVILNLKVEDTVPEVDPDENGKESKAPKKEKRLYYRFYWFDELCKEPDYTTVGKLIWEHHDLTTLKLETDQGIVEEKPARVGIQKKEDRDAQNKLNMMAVDEGEESKKTKDDEKPSVLYACDSTLDELVMIVIGIDGEQHIVYQFSRPSNADDPKERVALKRNQKPGNCSVQLNQNSFLRSTDEIFVILTTQKGDCSAKPLTSATEQVEKMPTVELVKADISYAKDCWINANQQTGQICIQTISKSSTDEYLNCSSIDATPFVEANDEKLLKKLITVNCKLKGQEIQMQFPCVASNIGSRRINVQSVAQPDVHSQFEIPDADFLCFASYYTLQDIGFKDKRKKIEQLRVPLNETGEYIAFLTRAMYEKDKGEGFDKGCILLNILYVESFAEPMTFTLFTTNYEANMAEGARDDVMHKVFAFSVQSTRGVDVTLCNQYNDSIIFDCITSTRQKPISFPLNTDQEDLFEDLQCCKKIKIVPVSMLMDYEGSIYFLVSNAENQVKVYRVNTDAEMGDDAFFQQVYSFQSSWVYFFLQEDNQKFYLMDESKRIKVLVQDPKTKMLYVETTMDLCKSDKEMIERTPFDEYAVSPGVVHWNNLAFTMIESKTRDNPTWYSSDVMLKGYECIAGPKRAYGSGLIYYVESYQGIEADDDENEVQKTGVSLHGQYCIVMMPKADLSFVECLPLAKQNNNNFFSFIAPDRVMAQYGGRFLVYDTKGNFMGCVKFDTPAHINVRRLTLVSFCESKQYFVFEGPEMTEEQAEKAKKKKDDPKKEEKKGIDGQKKKVKRQFYVFFMTQDNKWFTSRSQRWTYTMRLKGMDILPVQINDTELRHRTTSQMNTNSVFEQIKINRVDKEFKANENTEYVKYQVTLLTTKAYDQTSQLNNKIAGEVTEESFAFEFNAENLQYHKQELQKKIKPLEKQRAKALKFKKLFAQSDELDRLNKREYDLHKAWKYGEYVIVKCGSDIKFANIKDKQPQDFSLDLGKNVWLHQVYQTSVQGLIQFYVINDEAHEIYVITWNMALNREHALFQTTFKPGQFPENLILQSYGSGQQKNFNFCLEDGCIINLESNVPIQFFDKENEGDLIPHGALKHSVPGQKKVSEDRLSYLDLLCPGRIQQFISLYDLTYWERFQTDKSRHELSKGKVTTFAPIARFPRGISIFHYYATNLQVLKTFESALELAMSEKRDDKRITLFPLMFLHKHPVPNKAGQRVTPLQVAMEKQSPVCFETMLQMLTTQTSLCITGNLLGKLREIIDMPSTAVQDLMNNSFRMTDQLDGPRPLEWQGTDEELFIDVPTAYLTDQTLQNLVNDAFGVSADNQPENEAEQIDTTSQKISAVPVDGYVKYNVQQIENIAIAEENENNIKQVEAKLLDFDWIFTENNAATLIKILAETTNDEIFSCNQIRVFIEFMWKGYYAAIYSTLFIPFFMYFVSFNLYATIFAKNTSNTVSIYYFFEMACLVIFGKNFITFFMLEIIQFKEDPAGYFTDFWNLLDLVSLLSCAAFIFFEFFGTMSPTALNVLGSFAVVLLWVKLFYWLRLFKDFSAFIRIISEIVKDIRVFSVMLALCLAAFANCIIVLNNNREINDQTPIFDSYVGWGPADALIHAYLTGLGDFNKDNYSEGNSIVVWIFFLSATVLVQLVFMNMLIAIMGESFGRITAIQEQSTLKELCVMMDDHIWLIKIGQVFASKRYILWLTPGTSKTSGTLVERQISQLRGYIEDRSDQSDNTLLRQMGALDEQMKEIRAMLESKEKPEDDEDEYGVEEDSDEEDSSKEIKERLTSLEEKIQALCDKLDEKQ